MVADDWTTATISVKRVKRSGSTTYLHPKSGSTLVSGEFEITEAGSPLKGTITLGDEMEAGDVYTISVQAGDAAEETVTVKIGGVYYASPVTAVAKEMTVVNPAIKVGTGTIAYSLTSGTNLTFDPSDGSKMTGATVSSATANKVNATLTGYPTDASDGYYYTTNSVKAMYEIAVTDVSVGGTMDIAKDATSTSFTICGLPASSTITCTEDVNWITSVTAATASDANGVVSLTCVSVANPADSPARSATITINGTLTFTITQAANP